MTRRHWIAGYRVGFGLLTVATVAFLFDHNRSKPDFAAGNFFSFFTIESNLFAAAVLLYGAARPPEGPSQTRDYVRGAATLYMTITGIVYGVLLAGYVEELGTAVAWADTVVHRIMPVVLVADWLIDPPRTRLSLRRAVLWLVYPLVFCVYSLIRGPIVDWYPYPFLDPAKAGSYAAVAGYCVGIAIGALLLAWLLVQIGNGMRRMTAVEGVRAVPESSLPPPVGRA